ncbi:MAG: chromosomal replication initiator protein DnaA, partial [Proteobacteria bacterium]|nr:chromosomal replication initiator protein DnaA [Pseudomonadota bacterium]
MTQRVWKRCVEALGAELSEQDLNTWIRPLQAEENGNQLRLLAPNRFVLEWVQDRFL